MVAWKGGGGSGGGGGGGNGRIDRAAEFWSGFEYVFGVSIIMMFRAS